MKSLLKYGTAVFVASHAVASSGAEDAAPNESSYFEDLPVVLSVSRLAQPLDETPAAVTVIDHEAIRRLGARDIYDVLRLVPGFLVSGWNGASPVAAYHNVLDPVGTKLQVFVDGRSVYSTYYLGGTQRGLQGVILEDVQRIEVLRGSNSAAYGADAFLGVINIVTRHTGDTHGALVSMSAGDGGVADGTVRAGWGDDRASFRVSASHRSDHGLNDVYDDSRIDLLSARADLRPTSGDEIMLQAGGMTNSWGDGAPADHNPANMLNPLRNASDRSWYLLGEWRRMLAPGEDVKLSFSYEDERYSDRAPYGNPNPFFRGVMLDWSGEARRAQAEFQHSFTPAAAWRAVWGISYRQESVWSPPLYYRQDWLSAQQARLFGNLEWRPHPQWVVNAGATWEKDSLAGGELSPRLAANFHLLPGHTLRAGVSKSERAPTLFEEKADMRYFNAQAMQVAWTWDMRGSAKPEHLLVREVGYLGEFRPLNLSVDFRGFNEILSDALVTRSYFNGVAWVTDKVNSADTLLMRGFEYQLRWRPTDTTQLWWSSMNIRSIQSRQSNGVPVTSIVPGLVDADGISSPHRTDSLALFQSLPADFDLTVTYSAATPMTWNAPADVLPAQHRADLRLARRFVVGSVRAEAALTVQAANGAYEEFLPTHLFTRRAFATLRLEY